MEKLIAFSMVLLLTSSGCSSDLGGKHVQNQGDESMIVAPEFPGGLDWLNTDKPLKIADLRGKIVMLDFWTYCCINCMHIIPDLKRLEDEFARELVVIGVHSAKFTEEQNTDNIRQAILRYEIKHPVVNDKDFRIWRSYGAHAWPTVVLIDPEGRIVQVESGEGVYNSFHDTIQGLVKKYEGRLNLAPFMAGIEAGKAAETFLSYPGKVLADAEGGRLFISDQNHNRILICNIETGVVMDQIGSGSLGFKDGGFHETLFNHPQGLTLNVDKLYIADTENHAIREADLAKRKVKTIAGTGRQGSPWSPAGKGKLVNLSSPWALAYKDGNIYIAMAGNHQIWRLRLKDDWVEPFAGNGREARIDGLKRDAALAQPSGLALAGDRLYFADSEVSAVRYVELTENGKVGTIVGLDLFEFGDVDGRGDRVRLQHPLGLAWDGSVLYVADTYNNKVKKIDVGSRSAETYIGNGRPGDRNGRSNDARLFEPGGLSFAADRLYIADTNNHQIRVVDLATNQVSTLSVSEPALFQSETEIETADNQIVGPGSGKIVFHVSPPGGHKLSMGSQVVIELLNSEGVAIKTDRNQISFAVDGSSSFVFPLVWVSGTGSLLYRIDYVYCSEGDAALCYPAEKVLKLPVQVEPVANKRPFEFTVEVDS